MKLAASKNVFRALFGYHCFIGCGSISSFCGKGKTTPLLIACKELKYVEALSGLGGALEVSVITCFKLRFVCHTYGNIFEFSDDLNICYALLLAFVFCKY